MFTAQEAQHFADHWIRSWNSHDLDSIMSHYATEVVLASPVVASLLNEPSGTLCGKETLRDYFKRGLEAYPHLTFTLHDVLCGIHTIVLYYTNQRGTRTAEFMKLDANHKVVQVVANYSV